MKLIAIDLGTTFIKGAVLNLDELTIHHIVRTAFPPPLPDLPPHFFEVEPQAVVAEVQELLGRLLSLEPEAAGLVMCSQMHGLVLTDPAGRPRSNAITWRDQRTLLPHPSGSGSHFDVIRERIGPEAAVELGNGLRPGLPLCALFWLAEEGLLPDEPLVPAPLPDFVLGQLSGQTPCAEPTNAASHGALNLATGDWHREVIAALGLERLRWPALRPVTEAPYTVEVDGRRLPCFMPVGDHQCAIVGALVQEDELSLNISTGSQVSQIVSRWQPGDYETRPFFDGRFLNTITSIPAGRALNALVDLLLELDRAERTTVGDPWRYIASAVTAIPETDLEVNLNFFAVDGGSAGAITNIREDNLSVGHLFRAAFKHMAENYQAAARRLAPDGTPGWRRLVFSGGVAQRFATLRDLIAARLQAEYRLCSTPEDTLLGLLALGLVAAGRVATVRDATRQLFSRYL